MKKMKKMKNKIIYPVLLAVLIVVGIANLIIEGSIEDGKAFVITIILIIIITLMSLAFDDNNAKKK